MKFSPETDMLRGTLGGLLLGASATSLMYLNGRITGVSGIFNQFITNENRGWRAWYVAGLGTAGLALRVLLGGDAVLGPGGGDSGLKPAAALAAGALVGFAVISFVASGMISVWATKGPLKPYLYGPSADTPLGKIMPYITTAVVALSVFGPAIHRALNLEVKVKDDDGGIEYDVDHKPTNGYANGHSNGHANGHSNGHANGYAKQDSNNSKRELADKLTTYLSGLLLGLGLGYSSMVNLTKVQGFLEVTNIPKGTWDPTLMGVLSGAVLVNLISFQLLSRMSQKPLLAPEGTPPLSKHLVMGPKGDNLKIDWRLIVGASMFGAGWGSAGSCPGPAILALAAGGVSAMYIVPGMVLGLELKNFLMG